MLPLQSLPWQHKLPGMDTNRSSPKDPTGSAAAPGPYRIESYNPEESVGYLIKRVRAALTCAIDREMVDYDVSHDQWGVLIMIAKGTAVTAAELSREIGCDTGSMTRTIDRLEAKGFVRRTRSEDDRRVVRLTLTETGKAL